MAGKCPPELEAEFIQDCATLTVGTLEVKYNRCASTIREWRLELRNEGKIRWWPGIRLMIDPPTVTAVEVEGDFIVTGDLEIPYHDGELLGYAVSLAQKFGIKKLIVAGDFVAMDELSPFPQEIGTMHTLSDTVAEGRMVLEDLVEWFEEILLIKGNHEQRGSRAREIGFYNLLERTWDLPEVTISYYKWCRVISGENLYRIEHPKNYAKAPGSVARERAEIEEESVLCGHTHHMSWSFAKNGKHQAIDIGHCTRPECRYYIAANGTTRYPKWNAGFWMIRNGYLYPFPKETTDWDFWLS